MTYEEAKVYFEREKETDYWFDQPGVEEVVDLAIEALEKQILKKPNVDDKYNFYCPSCGEIFEDEAEGVAMCYDFCPFCGQRIDWSEE